MSESTRRALDNAAVSSAMEGLPLLEEHRHIIETILNGEMTLQEYFATLMSNEES